MREVRVVDINEDGFCPEAARVDSPNQDARPSGSEVELLVAHGISLPPGRFGGDDAVKLFCNGLDCGAHPFYEKLRGLKVSAHFFIRRDGAMIQFVSCARRAWHAGESQWRGRANCNDFSVGAELEGADDVPYADAQYAAFVALARGVAKWRGGEFVPVAGHSDIAPGRKTDPGPAFDWGRVLAELGAGYDGRV